MDINFRSKTTKTSNIILTRPAGESTVTQKKTSRLFWFSLLLLILPAMVWANSTPGKYITITILKNDNLVNICKKYLEQPNDWKTIARINHLDNPHLIYAGKTLQIPAALLKSIRLQQSQRFGGPGSGCPLIKMILHAQRSWQAAERDCSCYSGHYRKKS
ncbi:MAG: LysM peptidoglycan-binding domain-containing protein, partial [Desulfobacula sp.]|nr:LysM peptidoglycan-binding domain-containing protein [Desulfobacula sp.]